VFEGYEPPHVEVGEGLVQGLHLPFFLAYLLLGVDLVDLVLADEVTYGRVGDEHFDRKHPAAAYLRNEGLAEYAFEDEGELRPYLGLLVGREDVDDAVNRLDSRVRVKRRQREVPRL